MIQRYFRDVRRRVERLEESRPKPPVYNDLVWFDEDGTVTMIAGPNGYWELDRDESEDCDDTFSSDDSAVNGAEQNQKPVATGCWGDETKSPLTGRQRPA